MKEYSNNVFPRNLCIATHLDDAHRTLECPYTEDKKFEFVETAIATTYRANYKDKDSGCLLLLINKDMDIATICHEALHIVRQMIEELPCPLNDDTEEVWCYLIGWVANCINDYMKQPN